jgi:ATP-dependent Clp protease adaptor protein ClpS
MEAKRRRHASVTTDHLALALLAVPEVVRTLRSQGVVVGELRSDLETRVGGPAQADTEEAAARAVSADLQTVIRAAFAGRATWTGHEALESLVRAVATHEESTCRDLLAGRGVGARWSLMPSPRRIVSSTCGRGGDGAPYRPAPVEATALVVFWNDDTSTMEGVLAILEEVFEMTRMEAMYVMMLVHQVGRATARRCDAHAAAALTEKATRAARSRGMPLRVTVEPANDDGGRWWARWLPRR